MEESCNIPAPVPTSTTNNEDIGIGMSLGKKLSTVSVSMLALFVSYGLFSLPGSFLPLYNLDRGISPSTTGIILSAVPFCYIFMCPVAARMLDRWSSKRLLLISAGLVGILTFMFAGLEWVNNNTLFIVACILLRVGQGVNGAIIDVAVFSTTAKLYPNNIALSTAVLETSVNAAIGATPYIGALLYENVSFMLAFVVPACAMVALFLVGTLLLSDVDCRRDRGGSHVKAVVTDWMMVFPAAHCAFTMVVMCFCIPILAPYTQEQFDRGPVFAGICLLVNLAGVMIVSPILGHFMDKCNPYLIFITSGFTLPLTYLFLGPSPFLQGVLAPSPTQLLIILALLGFMKPGSCNPSRIIMLDIYQVKHGHTPQSVQNIITSLYCGSFSFGAFLGVFIGGILAEYLTFAESTMIVGLVAVAESAVLYVFCFYVRRLKSNRKCNMEIKSSFTAWKNYAAVG